MAMTLTLTGSQDLGCVVASVLGRAATDAGVTDRDALLLVDAVSHAIDDARGQGDARVRVALAWAEDRIDIEIGEPDAPGAVRLTQFLSPSPRPGCADAPMVP